MRLYSLVLASTLSLGLRLDRSAQATHTLFSHDAQPIVVLLHHSVWFGSVDLPWFILYEDGLVIFPSARKEGIPTSYSQTRLPGSNPDDLLHSVGIGTDFFQLDTSYDYAPNVSDQETVFLYVWRGDVLKRVAVRAGLTSGRTLSSRVPAAFREAFNHLVDFHSDSTAPWHPDSIEVAAWPYEYAPDNPPLRWPQGWPGLSSPGTKHTPDPYVHDMYLMRLPYDHLDELRHLLERRREKQAIGISGHKLAVGYRLLFPGEDRWRQYFNYLEE
jgi:hypothetical protein